MEAKPPVRFRKLRIAWSVAWGTVAMLLCALWLRSYWWADIVEAPSPLYTGVVSAHGSLRTVWKTGAVPMASAGWSTHTVSAEQVQSSPTQRMGMSYRSTRTGFIAQFPYWFLVLVMGGWAAIPWFRFRYSLSTLLILTTTVAAVFGLIALAAGH